LKRGLQEKMIIMAAVDKTRARPLGVGLGPSVSAFVNFDLHVNNVAS